MLLRGTNIVETISAKLSNNFYNHSGDSNQTFIIGKSSDSDYNPNNYIWYSGKLWRIASLVKEVDYIRSDGIPVTKPFGTTNFYSQSLLDGVDYWGGYLNIDTEGTWYNSLSSNSKNMLATATWYSGIISTAKSYKLGICASINSVAVM